MSQVAARYNVHPNLIANWKKRAQSSMVDVFTDRRERQEEGREEEIQQLRAKIGELVIERVADSYGLVLGSLTYGSFLAGHTATALVTSHGLDAYANVGLSSGLVAGITTGVGFRLLQWASSGGAKSDLAVCRLSSGATRSRQLRPLH